MVTSGPCREMRKVNTEKSCLGLFQHPVIMQSLCPPSWSLHPHIFTFILRHSRTSSRRPSGFFSKWKKTVTPDIKMVIHTAKFLCLCPFPLFLGFYEMWEMDWKHSLWLASALAQLILTCESTLVREVKAAILGFIIASDCSKWESIKSVPFSM